MNENIKEMTKRNICRMICISAYSVGATACGIFFICALLGMTKITFAEELEPTETFVEQEQPVQKTIRQHAPKLMQISIQDYPVEAETPVDNDTEIIEVYANDDVDEEATLWDYEHYTEPYIGDDAYMLAEIMYWENGGGSDYLLLLTGSVVLNRVADKGRYGGDTIYAVWSNPSAYATFEHYGETPKIPERVTRLANYLLKNGSIAPRDVVYQAMFEQGSSIYYYEPSEYSDNVEYICRK